MIDLNRDGKVDWLRGLGSGILIDAGDGASGFKAEASVIELPRTRAEVLCLPADIDGDGDLDIVGYRKSGSTRLVDLYRNDLPAKNWLRVRPVGAKGNRGAAGAKIRLTEPGTGRLLWYEQVAIHDSQASMGYYGAAETERHFGLGDRKEADLSVEFHPSGKTVRKDKVAAGSVVRIPEE